MQVLRPSALCLALVLGCSDLPTGVLTGLGASLSFMGTARPDTIRPTIVAAGDSVVTSQLLSTSACFSTRADAGLDDVADLVVTVTAQERDVVCPAVVPAASIARVVVHGVPAGQRMAILVLRFIRLSGSPSSSELTRAAITLP